MEIDDVVNECMWMLTILLMGAAIGGLGANSGDGFILIDANAYLCAAGAGVFTALVMFKIRKAKGYTAGDKIGLKVSNATVLPVFIWPFFIGKLGYAPKLLVPTVSDLLAAFIYAFVFLSVSSLGLILTEHKTENCV
ncbi:hypothetical protein [Vibrio coralliilyticus]|uniref:Uncharacterized protein n=1 Tax=Vibrio coralliilyticus TaxID=190893 RepID=A0AAP7DFE9_9VIBR|nr:hypothetical protein [Vibrio coralliilyticus]NOI31827.1 hypothetical protein [Vibrio coralliilyticus]NOJ25271.1 hypothetical protein [Vibrio coralliilyticus]